MSTSSTFALFKLTTTTDSPNLMATESGDLPARNSSICIREEIPGHNHVTLSAYLIMTTCYSYHTVPLKHKLSTCKTDATQRLHKAWSHKHVFTTRHSIGRHVLGHKVNWCIPLLLTT